MKLPSYSFISRLNYFKSYKSKKSKFDTEKLLNCLFHTWELL